MKTNEDIYGLLIQQILPLVTAQRELVVEEVLPRLKKHEEQQAQTNNKLTQLNGSVARLQEDNTRQEGRIQAHQEEIAQITSRVSVLEAVGEERKEHQSELFSGVKEEQKRTWQQVVKVGEQVIDITCKVAVLGALASLALKAIGLM